GELLVWARQWNLDHPADRVRIIGVDPQDIRASRERLAAFLAEAYGADAAAAWAPAAADLAAADEQTAVFGDSGVSAPTRVAALEALSFLHQDAPLLVARFGAARIQDALASARDIAQFSDFNGGGGALSHSRDWYMAINTLAALAELGGQAKAVYWGHNSHVSAAPTRWGPTGAVLRQVLGCGYQSVATTFGRGAFVAQVPNDPEDRLVVSTLPEAQEETIESVIAGAGPGARLMAWGCGPKQGPMPQWLSEPRPLRWIGGLFAPDTPASATYRPYSLTEAFDGIVYFPAVTAEEIPPGRPIIPARSRAAGTATP
ncbi:MAG TPA: erythromycin esterase family protein, partial [Allosphingosinicella sp.]